MVVNNNNVQYLVEIQELQTELGVFEVRVIAHFGTWCRLGHAGPLKANFCTGQKKFFSPEQKR